ncbi:dnaJ protein ERDJ3A-like isoform X1 [Primulina huaijiensis]|uniref:dnaJ protein ERDJ3A-like isoform X1 n=1 Tax=Primulina huaijiensis TaxID=1492673 RepID=UPI003CC79538
MKARLGLLIIAAGLLLIISCESKKLDPYKVLGVDRSAGQREIQKAFHKLSLQYHPDKNKNKGAQEKFAEINNAYDILSDEQKRKNYDLFGDEKGNHGFDTETSGDHGGYTYFTSGGPGESGFNFGPGGQGGSKSFSFSFGGDPGFGGQNSFGFGLNDIFSNLFGGGKGGGSQFGGFGSSSRSQYGGRGSDKNILSVNSKFYKKEINDRGMSWLLLFYSPNLQGEQYYESVIEEVAAPLVGALKVGSINCESETSFCKELGVHLGRAPKVYVYSYSKGRSGSLVEYNGDLDVKGLKSFCQDNLPKISKGVNLSQFKVAAEAVTLPKVMLLSTKKNTPVIWRALSGLYHKRFAFYNAVVHDVSDPSVRALGVDSLPAIVGWLSNGEKVILKSGVVVKDLQSAVQDLSGLLENFEKKNKKVASSKTNHPESGDNHIRFLTGSNFHDICGDGSPPVCLIGAFRSSQARDNLQTILQSVSQKSFSRKQTAASGPSTSISYSLLDATKHQSFLNAFEKSGFKSSHKFLVAYKPKRGTFATFQGDITEEAVENFIISILNADVRFTKTKQKPILK